MNSVSSVVSFSELYIFGVKRDLKHFTYLRLELPLYRHRHADHECEPDLVSISPIFRR